MMECFFAKTVNDCKPFTIFAVELYVRQGSKYDLFLPSHVHIQNVHQP